MANVEDKNTNAYITSPRDSPKPPDDIDDPFHPSNKESMSVADNIFFKKFAKPHMTRRNSSGRSDSESDHIYSLSNFNKNSSNDDEQIEYRPGSGFVHKLMCKFQRASSLENLLDGELSPRNEKLRPHFGNQSAKNILGSDKSQNIENIHHSDKQHGILHDGKSVSHRMPLHKDTRHTEIQYAPDVIAVGIPDIEIIENEPLLPTATSTTNDMSFKNDSEKHKYGEVRTLRDETETFDELPKPNTVSSTRSLFETSKSGEIGKPKWRKISATVSPNLCDESNSNVNISKSDASAVNKSSTTEVSNVLKPSVLPSSKAINHKLSEEENQVALIPVSVKKDQPTFSDKVPSVSLDKKTAVSVNNSEINAKNSSITPGVSKFSVTEPNSSNVELHHFEAGNKEHHNKSSVLFENATLIYSSDDVKKPPKRRNKENLKKNEKASKPSDESSPNNTPIVSPRTKSKAPLPVEKQSDTSSTKEYKMLENRTFDVVRDKNDHNSMLNEISVEPPSPRREKLNYPSHSSHKQDDQTLNHAQESTLENGEVVNSIPERGVPTIIAKRRLLKGTQMNGSPGIETNSLQSAMSKTSSVSNKKFNTSNSTSKPNETNGDANIGRPNIEDFIGGKSGLKEIYSTSKELQPKTKNNVPKLDLSGINDTKEKPTYSRRKIEPCKFIVIGGNIIESPILKRKKHPSKQKGNISFNEENIRTEYEYPSEEFSLREYLEEHPGERAVVEREQLILDGFDPVISESSDDANESSDLPDTPRNGITDNGTSALKSNIALGGGGSLSSYKSKLQMDYTFGMALYEAETKKTEPEPVIIDENEMELTPADDTETQSWSAQLSTTDSLF